MQHTFRNMYIILLGVYEFSLLGHRINFYFHLSKKSKFNFGTEKISLHEQYILGSDSGQLETRTVDESESELGLFHQ